MKIICKWCDGYGTTDQVVQDENGQCYIEHFAPAYSASPGELTRIPATLEEAKAFDPDPSGEELQYHEVEGFRLQISLRLDEQDGTLGYCYDPSEATDLGMDDYDIIVAIREAIDGQYPLYGTDLAVDQPVDINGWRWIPLTIWQAYQCAEQSNDYLRDHMDDFRADLATTEATPAQISRILDAMWETDCHFSDTPAALDWLREAEEGET